MSARTDHDRELALRLTAPGELPLTMDEACLCFDSMTMPEQLRVGRRYQWIEAAFERPINGFIQAVSDEVCAIAANLPPDIGE